MRLIVVLTNTIAAGIRQALLAQGSSSWVVAFFDPVSIDATNGMQFSDIVWAVSSHDLSQVQKLEAAAFQAALKRHLTLDHKVWIDINGN